MRSAWLPLLLAALAGAIPSSDYVHKVKESIPQPQGWSKSKPAPANHIIELRIALPQSNFAELERHLYEVR